MFRTGATIVMRRGRPDPAHALAALCVFALMIPPSARAAEEWRQQDVIISANHNTVRWAAAYKILPERPDDPYLHVRVFEHKRGWQPWRYRELAFHMAVTPDALERSRSGQTAKIYHYKDVEIRAAYRRWLDDVSTRGDVPVCETDLQDCLKRLAR